jgi:hypothetical protein
VGQRLQTTLTLTIGAVLWTVATTASLTASAILVGLAWLALARPTSELIVLTLTNGAALLLLSALWPNRPQVTWSLGQWCLFAGSALVTLWLLSRYGLPCYLHRLSRY